MTDKIRELPGIDIPKDTDFLWRYMSFEKFVSLLYTRSLYFTRSDKFNDPFEGFTPPSVKSHFERTIDDITTLEKIQDNLHKYIYCSCWHHAEDESMGMWEKYHMHNSGIAIKTTFGDFKKCLVEEDEVYVGKINYISHYEYQPPKNLNEMKMLYTSFFHKRKPFEYEQEFRAIISRIPLPLMKYFDKEGNFRIPDTTVKDFEFLDTDIGKPFRIDPNKLICEVITSPFNAGENWITDTVKSVVKQYGYDFNVHSSTLLDPPIEDT